MRHWTNDDIFEFISFQQKIFITITTKIIQTIWQTIQFKITDAYQDGHRLEMIQRVCRWIWHLTMDIDYRLLFIGEWFEMVNVQCPFHHYFTVEIRFNRSTWHFSILMILSSIGNITVLVLLLKRRLKRPSRIDTMLTHLAIADLLVTFFMMPLEIGWAYTVSWKAGDFMCRLMSFLRTFGLYLSSFVLVCISVDR